MIELIGLSKRYGEATVVDDLSLEVKRGELLVLLGAVHFDGRPAR